VTTEGGLELDSLRRRTRAPGARAQRHPPLHRGADDPCQQRGLIREPIPRPCRVVPGLDTAPYEQFPGPVADEHLGHLGIVRRRRRLKREAPARAWLKTPSSVRVPASGVAERHEVLVGAPLAAKAREAALERATRQEVPELPLDELREAEPFARLHARAQEGLQMFADDLIEHGVLGVSRLTHVLYARHSPGYRAREDKPMPTDGYATRGLSR
jgi:hypothetical protein